jgi:hypothetical protein
MAINAFSNLSITISDGGTVPSLNYLSKKTYVDTGSGNVLKVSWSTPTAANNAVDSYIIYISAYNSATASYRPLYRANIGNVNEFYIRSSMLSTIQQSLISLHVYVEVISKYGKSYNGVSNIESVYVGRGCGSYTRVEAGYKQPVMKRTIALSQLGFLALADATGKLIAAVDEQVMHTKIANVQDAFTGWTLMQEFYTKDEAGDWKLSDIAYEALTDANGEIVTDENNELVYVL